MSDITFKGWAGLDEHACEGKMSFQEFEPKVFDDDDVDVKILYCGICGSDTSQLSGHWGPVEKVVPQICGHELVGEVIKAGPQVENGIKVGDIVGVGAQSDSCRECEWCQNGNENQCAKQTITFNAPYNRGKAPGQYVSRGGFAKHWRGPSRFAIPIPSAIDPALAGPLLCGGVTVFSPLARYGAGTKAKKVAVIGVGGLGHMAILFAAAMGAEVTAVSRGNNKKEDAEKLGAKHYLATGDDVKKGVEGHEGSVDLIICTINPDHLPVEEYFALLRPFGTMVLVGVTVNPVSIGAFSLIGGNKSLAGSNIGSPQELKDMLAFAAEHDVKPWINRYNFDDINKALPDFQAGKPRYRFVLVNTDNGGKL